MADKTAPKADKAPKAKKPRAKAQALRDLRLALKLHGGAVFIGGKEHKRVIEGKRCAPTGLKHADLMAAEADGVVLCVRREASKGRGKAREVFAVERFTLR